MSKGMREFSEKRLDQSKAFLSLQIAAMLWNDGAQPQKAPDDDDEIDNDDNDDEDEDAAFEILNNALSGGFSSAISPLQGSGRVVDTARSEQQRNKMSDVSARRGYPAWPKKKEGIDRKVRPGMKKARGDVSSLRSHNDRGGGLRFQSRFTEQRPEFGGAKKEKKNSTDRPDGDRTIQ